MPDEGPDWTETSQEMRIKFCACWEIVRAIAVAKYPYRIQYSITISNQRGRLFGNRTNKMLSKGT